MLKLEQFVAEIVLLQKRFNFVLDAGILQMYFEILSAELSAEEFVEACKKIIRHEKFFPAPQDFIDRVKGSILQRALIEWQTEYACRSIVGKRAWDSLPPDEGLTSEIKYRRKQFLEAYEAFAQTASAFELELTPPLPKISQSQQELIMPFSPSTQETGEEARARIRQIFAKFGREI